MISKSFRSLCRAPISQFQAAPLYFRPIKLFSSIQPAQQTFEDDPELARSKKMDEIISNLRKSLKSLSSMDGNHSTSLTTWYSVRFQQDSHPLPSDSSNEA